MDSEENQGFWKWLRDKARSESHKKPFEPIPLHISIDMPGADEKESDRRPGVTEVDFEVESIVFES